MNRRSGYYFDPRVAAAYDRRQAGIDVTTDDIPFYVEESLRAARTGRAVLELGCGTGRVTLAIARAGVEVTGLDYSPAMLDVARARTPADGNPSWMLADMAGFDLGRQFGLVIIPFRSFCLLETRDEQRACLAAVREHLVEGGRLALNLFNPSQALQAAALAQLASLPDGRGRRGPTRSRRSKARGGSAAGEERPDGLFVRSEHGLRLRCVFPAEMEHLLAHAGLEKEALFGWFDRRAFEEGSSEQVWLARRR